MSKSKFNNGNGATLCNDCNIIITEGLTEDLYCNSCFQYRQEVTHAIRSTLIVLNKISIPIAVDKIVKLIK